MPNVLIPTRDKHTVIYEVGLCKALRNVQYITPEYWPIIIMCMHFMCVYACVWMGVCVCGFFFLPALNYRFLRKHRHHQDPTAKVGWYQKILFFCILVDVVFNCHLRGQNENIHNKCIVGAAYALNSAEVFLKSNLHPIQLLVFKIPLFK